MDAHQQPQRLVIIGGGPAGLAAALEAVKCGAEPLVLERLDKVGGLARTIEHDGKNGGHALTRAAAAYALNGAYPSDDPPWFWPWDRKWWKPKDERRDLVRAAALLIARIEQIDRKAVQTPYGMIVYPGRLYQAKRHGFTSLLAIILVNDLLTAAALAFAFCKGWIGS